MDMKLHANATTTPKTRASIQASRASVAELAAALGVSETTIRRWRGRREVADRSHAPKRQAISLSPLEEQLVVELRGELALSLDDIVEVMRRCCNPQLSRSAIHRTLVRHGMSRRARAAAPVVGRFEPAPVGFIHVDLKHLTRLQGRPALVFVAIDRATRFVHVEIMPRRDAETAAACLERFLQAFPHPVATVLTDNGSEFTDRFGGARWGQRTRGTGRHAFDRVCAAHGIAHRLTRPFHPQTNGMVERFNRRLAELIRTRPGTRANEGKNKFTSHAERDAFLHAFVDSYNRTRLKCLDYQAPAERLANLTGHNTCAGMTAGGGTRPRPLAPQQIHEPFQCLAEPLASFLRQFPEQGLFELLPVVGEDGADAGAAVGEAEGGQQVGAHCVAQDQAALDQAGDAAHEGVAVEAGHFAEIEFGDAALGAEHEQHGVVAGLKPAFDQGDQQPLTGKLAGFDQPVQRRGAAGLGHGRENSPNSVLASITRLAYR